MTNIEANADNYQRPKTPTIAGYPKHVVARYREWTNPHGVMFTDWEAKCGATRTDSGRAERSLSTRLDRVYKAEWCTQCNPGQTYHGAW